MPPRREGEGCWGPPPRRRRPAVGAARPPTAADSGQGEGAQALKGRSARSLMTGGGRGCRSGGGGVSNPAVRTGGEGGVGWVLTEHEPI